MRLIRGVVIGVILGVLGGLLVGKLTAKDYTDLFLPSESEATMETMGNELQQAESVEAFTKEILRFHVRANSDSNEDQRLKGKVKTKILEKLEPVLADADSLEETKSLLVSEREMIRNTAIQVIYEEGYCYDVDVYFTEEEFPLREYGDIVFPAGTYEALRVDIGEAKGRNWWCVLYPGLCFVDASYAVVPEEDKQWFEEHAGSMEEGAICEWQEGNNEIQIRSKLMDTIRAMMK